MRKMEILSQINWTCVELSDKKRALYTNDLYSTNNVGDIVPAGGSEGTLIASSSMGVTMFDLFGEIMTESDMKHFLNSHGVREQFRPGALSVRCFILLMDLNKEHLCFDEIHDSLPPEAVKTEPIEILEEIENSNWSQDSELDNENITVSFSDADSDDLESLGAFAVATFKPQAGKKRKNETGKDEHKNSNKKYKSKNICRGPGCRCGKYFHSREELQAHYFENGCYKCSKCDEKYPSERLLRLHVRHEHGGQGRNADWNSPFVNPDLLEIEKKTCRIASCEMVFESVAARLLHEQEFKHFKCEPCGVAFVKLTGLKQHRKSEVCHALVCDNCGKDFNKEKCPGGRSQLYEKAKRHVAACKNERKFVCDKCGMSFNQAGNLKKHVKKHSVEYQQKKELNYIALCARAEERRVNPRHFKCDHQGCEKAYTTNQRLKNHKLAIHSGGPKQFPCPICPKVMVNPETLQNHIKNVHQKNGSNEKYLDLSPIASPISGQETLVQSSLEKEPGNAVTATGLAGAPGVPMPSSSAIAGIDSRYSLLNYPFFHPGPC